MPLQHARVFGHRTFPTRKRWDSRTSLQSLANRPACPLDDFRVGANDIHDPIAFDLIVDSVFDLFAQNVTSGCFYVQKLRSVFLTDDDPTLRGFDVFQMLAMV